MKDRGQSLKNLLDKVALYSTVTNSILPTHCTISGLCSDSKKCQDHFLFVALEGATKTSRNGHDFIDEAIKNGACAVAVKENFPLKNQQIPVIRAHDTKQFLCHMAEVFFDFPSKKLKLIGITGTNGKTSTSFMLHSIFKTAGFKPKIVGTLGLGDPYALQPLSHTTMDPLFLSEQLNKMVNDDVTHVIMEVSSHALSLKRVDALYFCAVALTNITVDHLDFHETWDNYKLAKARLFFELACKKNTQVVLPLTHPFNEKVSQLSNVTFFDPHEKLDLKLPFLGDFHNENAHVAVKVAQSLGISEQHTKNGLSSCPPIPGRLEPIKHRSDFLVFVDFAHTPHALELLLKTVRKLGCRRIIVVFGCGGDRDQTKRPLMGDIAQTLADMIIITDDNPRNEDPAVIRKQIRAGLSRRENIHEIPKRDEAIHFAIKNAQKNDAVVIAGKGHENYQIYQDHRHYFSDQEVARKVLDSL